MKLKLFAVFFFVLFFGVSCGFAETPEETFQKVEKIKARDFIKCIGSSPADFRMNERERLKTAFLISETLEAKGVIPIYPIPYDMHIINPVDFPYPYGYVESLYGSYEIYAQKIKALFPEITNVSPIYPEPDLIVREIPDDALFLEYYFSSGSNYLFVVSSEGIKKIDLCFDEDSLNDKIEGYLNSIESNCKPEVIGSRGEEISRIIGLDHVVSNAEGKSLLIFSPYGDLHRVPVHILPIPDDGCMLIEKYRVLLAPSATAYANMKIRAERKSNSGESYLFFVDSSGLGMETDEKGDARLISKLFCFTGCFLNQDFTRSKILSDKAVKAKILHVSSPLAVGCDKNPDFSKFYAWQDEIYYFNILCACYKASLAILDFPGSAFGYEAANDDLKSFSRAFMMSGADEVIGNVLPGKYRFSPAFWINFYRCFKCEKASAAFQKAVLASMKMEPPSRWAGYVIMGVE